MHTHDRHFPEDFLQVFLFVVDGDGGEEVHRRRCGPVVGYGPGRPGIVAPEFMEPTHFRSAPPEVNDRRGNRGALPLDRIGGGLLA